jgi:hypothetical protein
LEFPVESLYPESGIPVGQNAAQLSRLYRRHAADVFSPHCLASIRNGHLWRDGHNGPLTEFL